MFVLNYTVKKIGDVTYLVEERIDKERVIFCNEDSSKVIQYAIDHVKNFEVEEGFHEVSEPITLSGYVSIKGEKVDKNKPR